MVRAFILIDNSNIEATSYEYYSYPGVELTYMYI